MTSLREVSLRRNGPSARCVCDHDALLTVARLRDAMLAFDATALRPVA